MQKKYNDFTQLSQGEREQIYAYLKINYSMRKIAKLLGRSHTTISRELDRNSLDMGRWKKKYSPQYAQKQLEKRRKHKNRKQVKLIQNNALRTKIRQLLSDPNKCLSPDEILGYLKREWREVVSTTTLYRYIHYYSNKRRRYLRFKKEWYTHKRWKRKHPSEKIKWVEKIDKRPKIIDNRIRIWDWELDTIVGKGRKWGLVTAVDRKSRYLLMMKIPNFKANTILTTLTYLFQWHKVKSLTSDNGSEFAKLASLAKRLKVKGYTTHAYASWEKWTNERHNGLVRRFIPKQSNIIEYSDQEILNIQNIINRKYRKILDYKCPYGVYYNL